MSKLTWIACNGVKPDLPDGAMGWRLRECGKGVLTDLSAPSPWSNAIAYALEPVDPVKELVDAARKLLNYQCSYDSYRECLYRLRTAIKAVEEMG